MWVISTLLQPAQGHFRTLAHLHTTPLMSEEVRGIGLFFLLPVFLEQGKAPKSLHVPVD